MKLSRTNFIQILLIILVLFMLIKSAANILKALGEIKNPPLGENVKVCPPKTAKDFAKIPNGDYLYALYLYESLGVKCKN